MNNQARRFAFLIQGKIQLQHNGQEKQTRHSNRRLMMQHSIRFSILDDRHTRDFSDI